MADAVAIVGMAAVFPGAPDLDAYWRNIAGGVDAIREAPAARVDPVFFADNAPAGSADRFYCRRGGFIEPVFDPIAFGIMPVAAAGAEPDQLLALSVAAKALDDAGCAVPRDRTAVILGRGGYVTPGIARLTQRIGTAQQLVTTLAELVPDLDAATLDKIRTAFAARAGEAGPETAIGLVPNLAASRIASRLDLRGPAYTVDAACASSLIAVDHGMRELASGRCDLIVAGGVHVCHDVTFWSVFTQLGALSRAQRIRPFDRSADGILIGEGAGIVVLKRLADAERDGDRIYAVLRGAGVSSDGSGASPMRPRLDGQLAALGQAWRAAERDPATVGLVEAHGTATPTGDEVELRALGRQFGPAGAGPRAVVGSVKSMIGHAMPAAGAAGLIKTALAIHHGVLPPSLHCDDPHPELERTRFRVIGAAEPWRGDDRRAGVSAFGFGGINAHVVLEQHAGSRPRGGVSVAVADHRHVEVLALAADSIDELRARLATDRPRPTAIGRGRLRLAIVDPTPARRAQAGKVLDRGKPWRGNHDIFFAPRGFALDGGKIALLAPGVEAAFAPAIAELPRALGVPLPPTIEAARAGQGATPAELERRGFGVFALGRYLAAALDRLRVRADAIAGHSIGEWTGMALAGVIPPRALDAFVAGLGAGSLEVPDVVFAAVGCSANGAEQALDGLDAIAVSHDNCPHQAIICGKRDRVRTAIERLGARGVLCQELPFRSGFHSPLFADYLAPHRRHLAGLELVRGALPLWSATTCAPYPDDPVAIRALAIEHLVAPVRFRELVDNLYASGVRAFVQLGVGSLAGFVGDTLRGKDHLAIAAASDKDADGGVGQLARVGAALWAEGFDVGWELAGEPAARVSASRVPQPLALGVPLVKLGGSMPAINTAFAPPAGLSADPIAAELLATLRAAADASRAIVEAWRKRDEAAAPRQAVIRRSLSADSDPALLDHCFYRQPAGWPIVADRYPVVPMTMTIGMMIDAARTLAPDRVAIALEDIRAYRWLAVAPPVEIELRCVRTADDRVEVEIPGYSRATVRLAAAFPAAPAPALAPLSEPRTAPMTAARMYADRWMFHGPAYQGVAELGQMADGPNGSERGVDGVIEVLPAHGALLDCAGQLMGWWVMQTEARDRLAMPVRLERVELFGPEPAAGERVACSVRIRDVREREVRADLELTHAGRVWARITGWEDRRFDSDDAVWAVLMYPERNVLATAEPYALVTEHWHAAASRELMMRRYLTERERTEHDAMPAPRRRGWLLGRIAIKDAVRRRLWHRGGAEMFPVEVAIGNDDGGRPHVTLATGAVAPQVSVAHKDDVAVALVDDRHAVGVDIEKIASREPSFVAVAFTAAELALGAGRPRDEWLARLWTAKEALGKARGTGVTDPRKLEVRAAHGDRLTIDDATIDTRREGPYIVAWTTLERTPS